MEIHFAPMQGFTDATFRTLHSEIFGGVDRYYTPFIRVERGEFRRRDLRELPDGEANTVPQMIGTPVIEETKMMISLLEERGYEEINVNLGCPFPMIVRKGMGCGMMNRPDDVKALVDELARHPNIRFSLKLRLGVESSDEIEALMPIINGFSFSEVTLHPRVGKQQYSGDIDMDAFAAFAKECKHPLLYNGDIISAEDFARIESAYPNLKGIMIGRGMLMNPALAAEIKAGAETPMSEKKIKVRTMLSKIADMATERMNGEEQAVAHVREYWQYLLPEAEKRLRKKVQKASSMTKYKSAVAELIASL